MKTGLILFILGIAILGLTFFAPRTAFAGEGGILPAPAAGTGCFDPAEAMARLTEQGYKVRGLGFIGTGKSVMEIWSQPGGGFNLVVFDGETAQLCIVAAGTGWQNYMAGE